MLEIDFFFIETDFFSSRVVCSRTILLINLLFDSAENIFKTGLVAKERKIQLIIDLEIVQ